MAENVTETLLAPGETVILAHVRDRGHALLESLGRRAAGKRKRAHTRAQLDEVLGQGAGLVLVDATSDARRAVALCRRAAATGVPTIAVGAAGEVLADCLEAGADAGLAVDVPARLGLETVRAVLRLRRAARRADEQAACAEQAAREIERLSTHLALVNTVSEELTRATEILPMLDRLYESLLSFLPFDSLGFLWCEEQRTRFVAYSHWLIPAARGRRLMKQAAQAFEALSPHTLDARAVEVLCRSNELDSPPEAPRRARLRAFHLPMVAGEQVFGTVQLLRPETAAFTAADLSLFATVVGHLSVAVYNLLLLESNRRLAITDSLTRLYNRRYMQRQLDQECHRAARYRSPFSFVLLDVDHFKRINDRYGHMVGDEVLAELARRLLVHVRDSDVVFRYGGEEFAVLLPETGGDSAFAVAERLRGVMADTPFETSRGPISVTISAGVASKETDAPGVSADGITACADNALYAAKEAGRNRVCRQEARPR